MAVTAQIGVNGPDTSWSRGENQWHCNVFLSQSYCLSCVRCLVNLLSSSKTNYQHT